MSNRIKGPKKPVGHFIAEWRDFRGLTQDMLAERLGTSKASISRIESGKQPYSQPFLEACAEALTTDAASLIMRNPADKEAIWSIWDQAKPGQRKQIVSAAEKVLGRTGS
jgi:transcriptional regulator with XRE-family HTH domain